MLCIMGDFAPSFIDLVGFFLISYYFCDTILLWENLISRWLYPMKVHTTYLLQEHSGVFMSAYGAF